MNYFLDLIKRKDILQRIMIERLTEPLHLNLISIFVALFGSTRLKVLFDLMLRQQHAYGLLVAADEARKRNLRSITVVELGVGSGTGLMNLCDLAVKITKSTGIEFKIFGFDTGVGMPPPEDYRDHPELYKEGWFPMDQEKLTAKLPPFCKLIVGNLKDTLKEFVENLSPDSPLGFATLDVDYYSSSVQALGLFKGKAISYLPVITVYVDDMMYPAHNPYCGEQLAIQEFNQNNTLRKITPDPFLPHRRVFKHAEWLTHIYNVQVLDHPERTFTGSSSEKVVVANPYLA